MSEHVKSFAAVDLGASSGRVMVGRVGPESLKLTEAHRFPSRRVRVPEGLRWDILSLYAGVLDGLRAAGQVDSVGIDSWAVDYGLLDADGALLGNPVHYRDARTEGVAEKVWATVPAAELYAATGLQYAPFNTLYQLTAARSTAQLVAAERLLLVPDLLAYWLTGEAGTEITNASTTQLIDPRTRDWSHDLADRLGIDLTLFAPLRQPGDPAGLLLPDPGGDRAEGPGPGDDRRLARHRVRGRRRPGDGRAVRVHLHRHPVLAGLELERPVLTEASRAANFTNELGLDGTVRYLRNIMGLWLLQECVREWGSPIWVSCCGSPRRCPRCGRWWTRATPRSWPLAGCRTGFHRRLPGVGTARARVVRRDHPLHSRSPPSPTAGRSARRRPSPTTRSTSSTSSAAVPATSSCAN